MADFKSNNSNDKKAMVSNNMRLFGLPFQFIESVDPRIESVSNVIGSNFVERIIMDAPTCMIIPGRAVFLPNSQNKQGTAHALLKAAHDSAKSLLDGLDTDGTNKLRYYDFEESYTEYMKYVNIMCRTLAVFLEIKENSCILSLFKINGK